MIKPFFFFQIMKQKVLKKEFKIKDGKMLWMRKKKNNTEE